MFNIPRVLGVATRTHGLARIQVHIWTRRAPFSVLRGSAPTRTWTLTGAGAATGFCVGLAGLGGFLAVTRNPVSADAATDAATLSLKSDSSDTATAKSEAEAEAEKQPKPLTPLQLTSAILSALKPDALLLFAIVVTTAATAAVNIATPTAIGSLVAAIQTLATSDAAAAAAAVNPDPAAVAALLYDPAFHLLALFGAQGILTCIDIVLVTRLGENLSLRLKDDLYRSLLSQDMAFFDKHMQGDLVGRLSQDVAEFKHTFKLVVTQGLKCATQIVFTTIHLLQVSQKLSLALLATMPFLYIAMNLYGIFLRRISKRARISDSHASAVAGEAISNIRTVRAFAAESREVDHYMDAARDASNLNSRLGFHIGVFQGMTNFSIGSMILVILAYGGNLVGRGELTGGQLMTYMISTQNAQRSLASLGVLFGQAIKALGSAARIFEYIQLKPSIIIKENALTPVDFKGDVEFKNVSFRYPTRPDQVILDRFSLHIPVGRVIALCGASGSGKSTVGQLIERFYDVGTGSVTIDGVDVRDLDPNWIREHIGYINQEPVLFATSIFENIRYGAPGATKEQVEAAARQANASDFIEGFPQGYDTVVGERGVTLSGGQKQRIAIARAILKDPKFLILDEATSALDTHSERIVQDALEKLMKNRTVLVIAHRLSTIQNADMIVVMSGEGKEGREQGNVVEMGTHSHLVKKRGAYYRLYKQLATGGGEVETMFSKVRGVFGG
ncbi:ATP-binding cassette, sub-B (MDR TAP), member 8 [Rhizoclosmatium hyalinum]|nr:ATP-binding cassette, sub-B (MDR TAP), member 8 [Rhizoclosmatium hyalinum]